MVLEDWVRKRPLVRTRRYTCVGVGIGACVCKITENRSWRFHAHAQCSTAVTLGSRAQPPRSLGLPSAGIRPCSSLQGLGRNGWARQQAYVRKAAHRAPPGLWLFLIVFGPHCDIEATGR